MGLCTFVGRVFLAAIFILSGVHKFQDQSGSTALFMSTRYAEVYKHLEALVPVPPEVSEFIHPKVISQHSKEIILAVAGVEVFGAVLVIFNSCFGATLLSLFIVETIVIIHNPWVFNKTPQEQQTEFINMLKNLAILGGLFLVGSNKKTCTVPQKQENKKVATSKKGKKE